MGKLGTRIVLAIPTTRGARRSISWIDAMAGLQMPLGSSLGRLWAEDTAIAEARNSLCEQAIAAGADYIFFLSDDVLPPPNALLMLLDKIGRTYPVEGGRTARASMITGVYWTKAYPSEPYLWNGLLEGTYRDWTAGEFFPVDLAGCDCLMIETAMLKALPKPWFRTDWVWEPGQKPSSIATEDFYFYTHARRHGFRLFADTSIQCYHEDRENGSMFGIRSDMRQAGGEPATPDDQALMVAEVGAGQWAPNYGRQTTVVRFDGRAEVKPDVRCDIRAIPERYHGRFDIVHAHHTLEHFPRREVVTVVAHWRSLLKDGGTLIVGVPNLPHAMRRILAAEEEPGRGHSDNYDWAQLYGDQQGYDTAFHRCGFTRRSLGKLLAMVPGLGEVTVEEVDDGLNLKATATRLPDAPDPALTEMWDEIEAKEASAGPAHRWFVECPKCGHHSSFVGQLIERCAKCNADIRKGKMVSKEAPAVTASPNEASGRAVIAGPEVINA